MSISAFHRLALHWPIQFEYWHWGWGIAFLVTAALVVFLGMRSLAGLGPVRKWVAIGVRLGVLALLIAVLCGIRWTRQNKDLELQVVRDISKSTRNFKGYPGPSFEEAWRGYLKQVSARKFKKPDDRVGEIVFDEMAQIESILNKELYTDAAPQRDPALANQTDAATALELALASFRPDAMHRILLVWDGNQTMGNVEPVVARAKSMGIPIDVMPLRYKVTNELMMDRFVGPTWRRENEPFTVEVFIQSTNITEVTGKLEVQLDGQMLRIDPKNPEATFRMVSLKPGLNRFPITVPGMAAGVKRFKATIDGQAVQGGIAAGAKADTLTENNTAEGFVVVKGKGKVLYIDNALDDQGNPGPGKDLAKALADEGIILETRPPNDFPTNQVDLQGYDAIVLHNVRRDSLEPEQDQMLASYVHEMGGGLVMIGGKDAFGAGGWQNSVTKDILPVEMEIPARRQMPKGALVLIMHSCEMPKGNYWGEQCAIQAVKALSDRDQIGVISYAWGGPGGAQWDFPLAEKGDGSKVEGAIKHMQLGDMPDFNAAVDLAVNGTGPKAPCLKNSDAMQKHIIVISDGDPQPPGIGRNGQNLYQQLAQEKISISTVSVYPHQLGAAGVPPTMEQMARMTKGRYYGPIESNPGQLPQIFIKEATVVRRSLIFEKDPLPLKLTGSSSDLIKGMGVIPPIRGMVLTGRKNNPQIDVPLVAGENSDPVLAHWQAGLGKVVVFTSDATRRWGNRWMEEGVYSKFWAQTVRSVARPPMSSDFDVRVTQDGTRGKIVVEAANKDAGYLNFVNLRGVVVGPDYKPADVRLVQIGPGVYTAEFDARRDGNYIAMLNYAGAGNQRGYLMGGFTQSASPETRDLESNDPLLQHIAARTGGRMIDPFDDRINLFERAGLPIASAPRPVWDVVIPILLALILIDVAVRRIAWDWQSTRRAAIKVGDWIRSFTTVRKAEMAEQTLGALQQVRQQTVAEQKLKVTGPEAPPASSAPPPLPNRGAKFEASQTVSGDISQVVGGAKDKPVPAPPRGKVTPKGQQPAGGDMLGGLMAAKRRAQEKMKEKEE